MSIHFRAIKTFLQIPNHLIPTDADKRYSKYCTVVSDMSVTKHAIKNIIFLIFHNTLFGQYLLFLFITYVKHIITLFGCIYMFPVYIDRKCRNTNYGEIFRVWYLDFE